MDYYLLDTSTMKRQYVIDDFISAIWAERYNEIDSLQLIVPLTETNRNRFVINKFISRRGSSVIMMITTREIKNNQLHITAKNPLWMFNHRIFKGKVTQRRNLTRFFASITPGSAIQTIASVANDGNYAFPYSSGGQLGDYDELVPGFSLGSDTSGLAAAPMELDCGPAWPSMQKVAKDYDLGIRFELAFSPSYQLSLKVYKGADVSSSVTFSYSNGSLTDNSELLSNEKYKNVCYAFLDNRYGSWGNILTSQAAFAAPYSSGSPPLGFDRRTMWVMITDMNEDEIPAPPNDEPWVIAFMKARAAKELIDHNMEHVVDGEYSINSEFKYGTDYKLGDIVGFEPILNVKKTVRITEYIWSQDETGAREYPTIELLD